MEKFGKQYRLFSKFFKENSEWSPKRPFFGIFETPPVAKRHYSGARWLSWEKRSNFRFLRYFWKFPGTQWIFKFSDTQNSKSEVLGNLTHMHTDPVCPVFLQILAKYAPHTVPIYWRKYFSTVRKKVWCFFTLNSNTKQWQKQVEWKFKLFWISSPFLIGTWFLAK